MAAVEGRDAAAADSGGVQPKYDAEFTDNVIAATGPNAHPRLKQIMPSLLRHLHDFAREVDLTVAEWMVGVDLINESGRMSDDKRNETAMLSDVLGLESLVDEITSKLLISARSGGDGSGRPQVTPSTVLGPFYRVDAPILPNGSSIITAPQDSAWYQKAAPMLAYVSGRVTSAQSGRPVAGASLDVWLAGPNGLYEQQDPDVPDMNLRGRFRTDEAGRYALRCLRPTAYPIPEDGPAGRLLTLLDRQPYRPAHIHFIVEAPGHHSLTTQYFDADDPHISDDTVFAVKKELLVRFQERTGDKDARWSAMCDFVLSEG
ncbi:aromatic compound dioxygenase [Durotheca rogersii]|uniref:aromatic compound dioxygenase n=1 Tax=Durotheca rogersii TaxID=419775 RepID=UPI0022201027|nr:aromatic compound dioxygenase [Durotheca rogersii]KAI5864611.1 aromatic compound dioxygenase [Durotheca rogersii]